MWLRFGFPKSRPTSYPKRLLFIPAEDWYSFLLGFKIINLDCVIGRRGITIQLPPSILVKLIILKPIHHANRFTIFLVLGVLALPVIMELLITMKENEVVKNMKKIASKLSPVGRVPYLKDCLYQGMSAVKCFWVINSRCLALASTLSSAKKKAWRYNCPILMPLPNPAPTWWAVRLEI